VVRDLAVMIAGGGTAISDRAVLRDQPNLFGEVASTPTAWRTLEAIDGDALERIAVARAASRRRVWAAGADPKLFVIDFDATLITSLRRVRFRPDECRPHLAPVVLLD